MVQRQVRQVAHFSEKKIQDRSNKWFHLSNSQERPVWPPDSKKVEEKCRIHLRKLFRDKFGVTNFEKHNVIGDSREKKVKPYVAIGDLNDVEEVYNLNSIMQK